jgi:hypothetical protein
MTDKERLEEIKEWFNADGEMHEFQIEWLIEQAEKAELLNKKFEWLKKAIEVCNDEKISPKELANLLNIHKN